MSDAIDQAARQDAGEAAGRKPPRCKLCGGTAEHFIERAGYPIVRCGGCGFMFALLPAGFSPADHYVDDSYFSDKAVHGIADYDSLWKHFKPGGLLALSTPNYESPDAIDGKPIDIWFIPPEHICYFGPRTINDCLKRARFDVLAVDGLIGAWRALGGDTSFPPWPRLTLGLFRKDKRLRPGGAVGKMAKRAYGPAARPELYRRAPTDLRRAEVLEIYARTVGT